MVAATGIITTIAGTGSPDYLGDGGPATAAALNDPRRLRSTATRLYIADTGNYRIREVEGVLSLIATWTPPPATNGVAAGELTLATPKGVIATYNDYNVAL